MVDMIFKGPKTSSGFMIVTITEKIHTKTTIKPIQSAIFIFVYGYCKYVIQY